MNKKYKDGKLILHFIILSFIIASTFFLSIGYASLESITLDIDGEVTAVPPSDVLISDVKYLTSANADIEKSKIHQYYQTLMKNTIVLGNSDNSSITYQITVYNNGEEKYVFKDVEHSDGEFYDNLDIVYSLEGIKQGDVLQSKQSISFSITFHYSNNTVSNNNILNSYLNFKFVKNTLTNPEEKNDIINILTKANKTTIYNAEKERVIIDITNNNTVPVNLNLIIDNKIIDTISLEAGQSKVISQNITSILSGLEINKEYIVGLEMISNEVQKKETDVSLQIVPTITNYDLGLKKYGTQENPYIIYKIEDLNRLAQNVNSGNTFLNTYIKLANNLDFNNTNDYYNNILSNFIIIGNSEANAFRGIFDGNNNTISNIIINGSNTERTGLFAYINNAIIKNLTISGNYNISTDAGSFVGGVLGNSSIVNCHNNVDITNSKEGLSVGGIVGILMPDSNVTIDGCTNNGNITNGNTSGGFVGLVNSSILTVTNSSNTGTIISTVNSAYTGSGGLVGKDSSGGATIILKNSHNSGEIRGKKYVDAFVGNMSKNGKLTKEGCTNSGNIILN